ncbi:Hemocyanin/hexamerin middle domain [Trinorchestia longiramus]|nr:Hemocyanin/hexamerin middle domain [Trinorchestia longiramus]
MPRSSDIFSVYKVHFVASKTVGNRASPIVSIKCACLPSLSTNTEPTERTPCRHPENGVWAFPLLCFLWRALHLEFVAWQATSPPAHSLSVLLRSSRLPSVLSKMATMTPTDQRDMLYLFERPSDPLYMPRAGNTIVFNTPDMPQNFAPRFGGTEEGTINVSPDDSLMQALPAVVTSIPRGGPFSLNLREHRQAAKAVIEVLQRAQTVPQLRDTAASLREGINETLFVYALSFVITRNRRFRGIRVPSILETFPGRFIPSNLLDAAQTTVNRVNSNRNADPLLCHFFIDDTVQPPWSSGMRPVFCIGSLLVQKDCVRVRNPAMNTSYFSFHAVSSHLSTAPIVVQHDQDFSGLRKRLENRVAYWREDYGLNAHHWHWHLVYPTDLLQGENVPDRKGELFYYMHQQIVARFDHERMSVGLPRVVKLDNFRDPIPDGYFSKLRFDNAETNTNRILVPGLNPNATLWGTRQDNTRLSNYTRLNTFIPVDVSELELWRDRLLDGIHQGFFINVGVVGGMNIVGVVGLL